ncbi:hypothetical protein A3724_00295 [Alcanivorax sp. HI0033]|jgi:hypothetical protein|uniref:hypothetical protein n=1 Tax=unclassified Alcanivorax TaxID=2638842 RepID=UPI0007B8B4CC|nr:MULTISPECIES: hypothetical protein [unclassified Alcanivorax]KZX75415.1 hypothetical protein A3717_02630 [Alcanivorax sp. HI0013]KZX76702.1 hypothetical protein A3716_01270 [Alcanivorax sp. HI0011]KZY13158.1 hypothetical protein A3725_01965 [Alcanivorax sp. HI0035]KZX65609.1 hypothetical protein A3713_04015 [Alcanivorax sp. HI0003]KZX71099.1 hypothetical protein A3714_06450 [Alcanivorax sp. HI0007]
MTEKLKAPAPVTAGSEGQGIAKHCPQHLTIGPRHRRLLAALERRTAVTREQADRIAHASNSPHYVGELRKRYGIPVQLLMASGTDYDGQKIQYGVYWLDGDGKAAARKLLREAS